MCEHLTEFTFQLKMSTSWDDHVKSLLAVIRNYGYDTFVIGVIPTISKNIHSMAVLEHNMDSRWIKEHDEKGWARNSAVDHCLQNNRYLLWSEIIQTAKKEGNKREIEISTELQKYYIGGVTIPLWTQWSPYRFGISFTSKDLRGFVEHDAMFVEHENEIENLARQFFSYANWSSKLIDHYSLTKLNIEVFEGLLKGKSRKEVAEDHGTSEHTIKYHVRNVARKFGVKTGEQAVVRFALLGISNFNR